MASSDDRGDLARRCIDEARQLPAWERRMFGRLIDRQIRVDPAFTRHVARYGPGATIDIYRARAMYLCAIALGLIGVVTAVIDLPTASAVLFVVAGVLLAFGIRRMWTAHRASGRW